MMFISVSSVETQPEEPLDPIGLFVARPQDGEVTVGECKVQNVSQVKFVKCTWCSTISSPSTE